MAVEIVTSLAGAASLAAAAAAAAAAGLCEKTLADDY